MKMQMTIVIVYHDISAEPTMRGKLFYCETDKHAVTVLK